MKNFFKIKNKCGIDLSQTEGLFHDLGGFAQKRFGFKKPPTLHLVSDGDNASKPLGKTAYYDPQSMSITIYTDNRHTKDILRSLAHELVHHTQNENGMLNDSGYHGSGYAQKNKNLRQSEKEAYLKGNMCFRDWEDGLKQSKPTIYNEWRIKNMSTKKWKNNELMENLSEKFGFKMDLSLLKEGAKPDFPDIDGDGDREEPISKAQKDKKAKDSENEKDEKSEDEESEKPATKGKKGKLNPGLQKYLDNKKNMNEDRRDEFEKGDEYDIDKDFGTYPYEHDLAGNVFYQSELNTVKKHKEFLKDLEAKKGKLHKAVRKPVGGKTSSAIKRMTPLMRRGHVTRTKRGPKEGTMNETKLRKIIRKIILSEIEDKKKRILKARNHSQNVERSYQVFLDLYKGQEVSPKMEEMLKILMSAYEKNLKGIEESLYNIENNLEKFEKEAFSNALDDVSEDLQSSEYQQLAGFLGQTSTQPIPAPFPGDDSPQISNRNVSNAAEAFVMALKRISKISKVEKE